jgi:transposase-like protein
VRRLRAVGVGISALARRFGVSRQTIYRAVRVGS